MSILASAVAFSPTDHEVPLDDHFQWWTYVKGANWRRPLGPESDLKGKEKYPVVQIAYPDGGFRCVKDPSMKTASE